jgi:AbrB family looped-hinge helix DNA binding protein
MVSQTVRISPKFQVVIPQPVREAMRLRPGEKVQVLQHGDHIELVPLRVLKNMRGALRGMDPTFEREADRI